MFTGFVLSSQLKHGSARLRQTFSICFVVSALTSALPCVFLAMIKVEHSDLDDSSGDDEHDEDTAINVPVNVAAAIASGFASEPKIE